MNNRHRSEIRPLLAEFEVPIAPFPLDSSDEEVSNNSEFLLASVLGKTKVTKVRDETTDDE